MNLDRVRIILIETSLAGNIGSVARAMKTMGLSQLVLVNPRCELDDSALSRASGATDILDGHRRVDSLSAALEGCVYVIGASARTRELNWEQADPRQAAGRVAAETVSGDVALIFGREDSGLRNRELSLCHMLVHIPANPEYSSLNIAAAVQVLAYECRMQLNTTDATTEPEPDARLADGREMDGFYQHLEQAMLDIGFFRSPGYQKLFGRLKILFNRARPDIRELNILRGILSAAQGRKRRPDGDIGTGERD